METIIIYLVKALGIVIIFLPVLFAAICHELGHAYTAYLLGDNTAKEAGRLTFNPIKHIDIFGTVIFPIILYMTVGFPLIIFKPVPVNHANLKNPNIDSIKVALAGPGANLLLVIITITITQILNLNEGFQQTILYKGWLQPFFFYFTLINLILMTFNLIPIPPLDGSWVIRGILPVKGKIYFQKYYTYFLIAFIVLVLTGKLHFILQPIVKFYFSIAKYLIGIQ